MMSMDHEIVDNINSSADYNYDVDEANELSFIRENGADISIELKDGRLNVEKEWSPLQVQVWPVRGEKSLYYIRLRTCHYSFCLKHSCVVRDLSAFYQLRSILASHNTYTLIPSLPIQPILWVSSYKSISVAMAHFLAEIIKQRELLSSKALHLFLQSPLSVSAIRDNVEGRRDDEVAVDPEDIITDDRKISREGFGSLFGGGVESTRN